MKQITEQGTKMKYVQYNTLRFGLWSTDESAGQPPPDLNGITPNQPRLNLGEGVMGEGVIRLPMTSLQETVL